MACKVVEQKGVFTMKRQGCFEGPVVLPPTLFQLNRWTVRIQGGIIWYGFVFRSLFLHGLPIVMIRVS